MRQPRISKGMVSGVGGQSGNEGLVHGGHFNIFGFHPE